MAETPQDVVNRELREFKRYTGDGLPGEPVNAPLPVGDPQSGVHNPKKVNLRKALLAPVEAAAQSASDAADQKGYAEEWAQSDNPISIEAGGNGTTDRSAKFWALQSETIAVPNGSITTEKLADGSVTEPKLSRRLSARVGATFDTLSDLIADTTLTYSDVDDGDEIRTANFHIKVAASDAVDQHYTTAGGVKIYRTDLLPIFVGVGPGGDFASINAALEYLSNRPRGYRPPGVRAEILLLSGFVQEEQVLVRQCDLSWINIVSEDAEVMIDRAALTQQLISGHYPAWGAVDNAGLPQINCLFNMSDDGVGTGRNGIQVSGGSWGIVEPKGAGLHTAGLINAGNRGFYCSGSIGRAYNSRFDGAGGMGIRVSDNGMLNARNSTAQNAGEEGCVVTGGSIANVEDLNTSGATKTGLYVLDGSSARGNGAISDNCGEHGVWVIAAKLSFKGGKARTNTGIGVRCDQMGEIDAQAGVITGNTHNVLTNRGGRINVTSADVSGGITSGVFSNSGGEIIAIGADCRRTPGSGDTSQDVRVASGGEVLVSATTQGGLSQTANSWTSSGIIKSTA